MLLRTAKHTVFNSLEDMLDLTNLSQCLGETVTTIKQYPFGEHVGFTGATLTYVDTNVRRFVLKEMPRAIDLTRVITDDDKCRSVTLWQHGVLDRLYPYAQHKIIACANTPEAGFILMEDLGNTVLSDHKTDLLREHVPSMLDTLARIHATFWNDETIKDEHIGLCDPATYLAMFSLDAAQKVEQELGHFFTELYVEGWKTLGEVLEPDVYQQMVRLEQDPAPLLEAIARYPMTLVHGDYKGANMAYSDHYTLFDFQIASYGLMTCDLAWFVREICVREKYGDTVAGRQQAIDIYRQSLEGYLGQSFDEEDWQAMVAIGLAINAIRTTCHIGYWYKEATETNDADRLQLAKNIIQRESQDVLNALQYL